MHSIPENFIRHTPHLHCNFRLLGNKLNWNDLFILDSYSDAKSSFPYWVDLIVKVNVSLFFSVTITALLTYFWQHLKRNVNQWEDSISSSEMKIIQWESRMLSHGMITYWYRTADYLWSEVTKLIPNYSNNFFYHLWGERKVS